MRHFNREQAENERAAARTALGLHLIFYGLFVASAIYFTGIDFTGEGNPLPMLAIFAGMIVGTAAVFRHFQINEEFERQIALIEADRY